MSAGWFSSTEVLAWVSWIGLAVTVAGFAATLWALLIALGQVKEAIAAAGAARAAVERLKASIASVQLGYLSAQIDTFVHLCQSEDYTAASVLFSQVRRTMMLQNEAQGEEWLGRGSFLRNIQAVEHQLNAAIQGETSFKASSLFKAARALSTLSTKWEFAAGSEAEVDIIETS